MEEIKKQLTLNVGGREIKFFMQGDFFGYSASSTIMHKNACTEIHCIECGEVEYTVDGDSFSASAGELIAIPPGVFHQKRISQSEPMRICIFQIDFPIAQVVRRTLSPDIYSGLRRSTEEYNKEKITQRLAAYLALICSYAIDGAAERITPVQDRSFLIREFFYNRYYLDATLSELAAVLNLSEKQTERCVLKYTGRKFREELAYRRIEAAKHIIKTEGITLAEAALRVGYRSYSGFWKAFNVYGGSAE